jgi:toxin ParE1/3/4
VNSRVGRKGRHLVIFMMADGQTIDVIRLLHDSMDLAKHLPD